MVKISTVIAALEKTTPGPWEVGTNQSDTVVADSKYSCAERHSGFDDVEYYGGLLIAESILSENRELIAAAPKMAAWIKKALPVLRDDLANSNIGTSEKTRSYRRGDRVAK